LAQHVALQPDPQAHWPPVPQAQPLASQAQSSQVHASPQQSQGADWAGALKAPIVSGATTRSPTNARPSTIFLSME
jgi:hypothetical protein